MRAIGIIAGGGALPRLLIEEAQKNQKKTVLCAFHGHTDESVISLADYAECFHIGQFSKIIKYFHSHDIKEICLAGTINKPKVLDFRPDFLAAKIIFSLKSKGDDALLRAILDQLEKEKLSIVSVTKLLPSLLAKEGVLTLAQPDEYIKNSVKYALPIIQNLGQFDIGQCLVVKENMVVAVECLEGTDATIQRGAELGHRGNKGCILVKMVKKGQDERVDLPSIGLKTVENLVAHKYRALIIEAGKTLFFDSEEALKLADRHRLVVWAIDRAKDLL